MYHIVHCRINTFWSKGVGLVHRTTGLGRNTSPSPMLESSIRPRPKLENPDDQFRKS